MAKKPVLPTNKQLMQPSERKRSLAASGGKRKNSVVSGPKVVPGPKKPAKK